MRLVLDLDVASEPPSGWLTDEDGERRRFVGLLELFALIEAFHRRAGGPAPSGPEE